MINKKQPKVGKNVPCLSVVAELASLCDFEQDRDRKSDSCKLRRKKVMINRDEEEDRNEL